MIQQMRMHVCAISLVMLAAAMTPAMAQAGNKVAVSLVSSSATALPGSQFEVALQFTIPDGWHLYNTNPGDTGSPPKIKWDLPPGVTAGELQFPPPKTIQLPEHMVANGYEHELTLRATITVDPQFDAERPIDLVGHVRWVVCNLDQCLAEKQDVNLQIGIGPIDAATGGKFHVSKQDAVSQPVQERWPGAVYINPDGGGGVISITMPRDFGSESDFTIVPPSLAYLKIDQPPTRHAIVGGMVVTQPFTLTPGPHQDADGVLVLTYTDRDKQQKTVEVSVPLRFNK